MRILFAQLGRKMNFMEILEGTFWKFLDLCLFYLIENFLEETTFNGFPLIVDQNSQTLCGYISRRDLKIVLSK